MTQPLQIIAFTGSAGTGKDTAADILATHGGFTRLAFADALRTEVQAAFNVPAELLTRRDLKEMPTAALALVECLDYGFIGALVRYNMDRVSIPLDYSWYTCQRTPRSILQLWGTEYRRAQRINYWLEALRSRITQLHALDGRSRFVVTDARFENEAAMIRAMGGVVWQITRDGVQSVEGQHASATDGTRLNPSVVIDNSSTLHSLREAVLGEWLALETQTDVISLDLADPAKGGYRPDRFRLAEPVQTADAAQAGVDHLQTLSAAQQAQPATAPAHTEAEASKT